MMGRPGVSNAAYRVILYSVFAFCINGCGYTTRSLLPPDLKSICVESFTNTIHIAEEQSDERMYRGYRPGMEADLTREVIDRYLFDGNLKVKSDQTADMLLSGELVDFRKEGLRYDENNNVEEYRVLLTVNLVLKDVRSGKVFWAEKGFTGEATYRTSGSLARGEESAIQDAAKDLARRIVERTVEGW